MQLSALLAIFSCVAHAFAQSDDQKGEVKLHYINGPAVGVSVTLDGYPTQIDPGPPVQSITNENEGVCIFVGPSRAFPVPPKEDLEVIPPQPIYQVICYPEE